MTSAINPNNIDGAYPVAGQDNNSQGFRDNFTNTKTNFQYAKDEITELQNKAVLKSALTGTTLNNNMLGGIISNVQLQDYSEVRVSLGTLSGTVNINLAAGNHQSVTTSGSIDLAFLNWPVAGSTSKVSVQIFISNVAHTVTLPSAVSLNAVGIQGYNNNNKVISFAASGSYAFDFTTGNGGTTVSIHETNNSLRAFNNSSEDLAPSAAANLAVTTSSFSTAATETATLAAGVSGQIKVFSAVDVTSGNMVITVTNAGWKVSGTGTITFSSRGASCILQYTNSKWFCIGNNGCVFA
jgi:hypothetical protein